MQRVACRLQTALWLLCVREGHSNQNVAKNSFVFSPVVYHLVLFGQKMASHTDGISMKHKYLYPLDHLCS